jgi:hypothetical protein
MKPLSQKRGEFMPPWDITAGMSTSLFEKTGTAAGMTIDPGSGACSSLYQ